MVESLVAALVVVVGAIIQGSVGFGVALVAAPVLVLLDPRLVPGPLLLAGFPFMLLLAWRERQGIDYGSIAVPVLGQLAGILLALLVLSVTDPRMLSLLIGLMVLFGAGLSISGLELPVNRTSFLVGGTLAGFMGTTSSMPGPALALIHQHVSAARMRSTLAPFFCVGTAAGLIGLLATGQMGEAELLMGLWLIPPGLAGFWLSSWTAPRVSESVVRPAVLIFSCSAALFLIYRSV